MDGEAEERPVEGRQVVHWGTSIYHGPSLVPGHAKRTFSIESFWALFASLTWKEDSPFRPIFAPTLLRHRHGRAGESVAVHSATGRLSR